MHLLFVSIQNQQLLKEKKKNITAVKGQFQPFQKLQEREGGSQEQIQRPLVNSFTHAFTS